MPKLLTRDEEYALGTAVQAGLKAQEEIDAGVEDSARLTELKLLVAAREDAVATFFEHNMALMHSIANSHQRSYPTNLEHDEVVNNGIPGLLKAIDKFDPERGNKFSTVATWWIRQAIGRATNAQHRMIRLPEHRIKNLVDINRLSASTGLPVTDAKFLEQVQEELGLSSAEVDMITTAASCGSLDRVIGSSEGNPWTLMNVAEETHQAPAAEDAAIEEQNQSFFHEAIQSLEPVETAVVYAKYKMPNENGDVLTPKDVRTNFKISQGTLHSTHEKALVKLRKHFESKGYEITDFLTS